MNDDPYGKQIAVSSILPLPAAVSVLLLLFVLGALFALCEALVSSSSESRVKKDAENGEKRAAGLLRYLEKNEGFASPLQFGMLLTAFFAVGVAVIGFAPYLDDAFLTLNMHPFLASALSILLCVLLCAALFLTLADFVPKKIGALRAARGNDTCYRFFGLIRTLSAVIRPLLIVCDAVSNVVMRMLGHDPNMLRETVTEEEILHMVGEGEESGVIEENELDMITNILDFNDTTVSEVMTHRTDVCAVSEDTSIDEVAAVAAERGFSRLPVYREDIDTIVGICYIKDFLPYIGRPLPDFVRLADMVRPAYFIPETKKCSQLFKELTERKVQIAVIVDEYGGTSGLITLEDLIESILGNIQDEYDNEEEEIFRVSENEFTVDGATSIDEISDLTGVELPEGDYDTIAGLVTETLGRIPKEDEHPSITLKNLTITVLQVEDQRLARLSIVKDVDPE